MDAGEVVRKAEELFVFDAEHHARVQMAVRIVEDQQRLRQEPMDDSERRAAIQAASVALVVATLNPTTGQEWETATAEYMKHLRAGNR